MEAAQRLINALACSRRQQTPICASEKSFDKAAAPCSDSESSLQSTEPGDSSTTDVSDHGEQNSRSPDAQWCPDSLETLLFELRQMGPDPELDFSAPPPGLDLPCDFTIQARPEGTRLNSSAPMFVPSFGGFADTPPAAAQEGHAWNNAAGMQGFTPPVQKTSKKRKTISLLKGLLQEWEASVPEDPSPLQQAGSEEAQALNALQEVVSKLTPNDAAMLRSLLVSKESVQNSATHSDADLMKSWQLPMAVTSMGLSHVNQTVCHNQPAAVPVMAASAQLPPLLCASVAGPLAPPPGLFSHSSVNSQATTPLKTWPQTRPRTPFGSTQPVKDTGKSGSRSSKSSTTEIPEATPQQPAADDPKETLRTNLRDLSGLDHERVLLVRKINRLGLKSPTALEAYFSKFGSVERIMVNHSRAKSMFGRGVARVRPAGLGFVLMSSEAEVKAILAAGTDHEIEGSTVCVYPFESRPMEDA